MSRSKSSVRMGPISLFTLVIIICLAVMAVLAMSTSQATYAAAEKQARFTVDTYANEQVAQQFVAEIDAALAPLRTAATSTATTADTTTENAESADSSETATAGSVSTPATSGDAAMTAVIASLGGTQVSDNEGSITYDAQVENNEVHATFVAESGRTLSITLAINSDATYALSAWKATTQWNETGSGATLWSGAAQSR